MDQPKDLKGRVVVNAKFLTTAFMFVEQPKGGAKVAAKTGSAK
jgi:hypothetical protein